MEDLASLSPTAIRDALSNHWTTSWQSELNNTAPSSQRAFYLSIHPEFTPICQPYLSHPSIPHQHRSITARFCCGNHWLGVYTSHYARAAEQRRLHNKPYHLCRIPTWTEPNRILFCDSCDDAGTANASTLPLLRSQKENGGSARPAYPPTLACHTHYKLHNSASPAPLNVRIEGHLLMTPNIFFLNAHTTKQSGKGSPTYSKMISTLQPSSLLKTTHSAFHIFCFFATLFSLHFFLCYTSVSFSLLHFYTSVSSSLLFHFWRGRRRQCQQHLAR